MTRADVFKKLMTVRDCVDFYCDRHYCADCPVYADSGKIDCRVLLEDWFTQEVDKEEEKGAEMREIKQSDSAVKIANAVKDFEAVVRRSEKAAVAPMTHASMGLTKHSLAELYCDALTSLYAAITDAGIDMGSVMPEPPSILKKLLHETP